MHRRRALHGLHRLLREMRLFLRSGRRLRTTARGRLLRKRPDDLLAACAGSSHVELVEHVFPVPISLKPRRRHHKGRDEGPHHPYRLADQGGRSAVAAVVSADCGAISAVARSDHG